MYSKLKITSVIGKNIKFKFLNLKLPLDALKLNYHALTIRSCRLIVNGEKNYSTPEHKYAVNESYGFRRKTEILRNLNPDLEDISQNVDKALAKIDWITKVNGRIMMKHVVEAFNMVGEKEINSTIHGLYLLRSCKYILSEPPSKRIELVNQIWNRFQELGIPFEVSHYNALLDVHIDNNFSFNPSDILISMEEQHIEPNKVTCYLLINKYCNDSNLSGASEILEYMKEKCIPANERVFNHLIEGHLKNNDFTGAKDMIEVMNSSNLKPTEDTYILFACAYATCGDKNKMMMYLNGENTNIISISCKNYLKVIEALAISGNSQYIDDVLHLMKNVHENLPEITNSAIKLIHKGCIDVAYKLIVTLANSQDNKGTNIFIKQLIKSEVPVSQVISCCHDILNKGINDFIFINAAKAAIDYRKIDYAFFLFKERLTLGYPVRIKHFLPIFSNLKDAKVDDIWLVIEKMSELGIPADFTLYLEHVFPTLGVPDPAVVIEKIKKTGQVGQIAYDALFVYYCNLGEIFHASNLIQMTQININPKFDFKSFLNKYQEIFNSQNNSSSNYFKVLKYILKNVEVLGQPYDTEILKGNYLSNLILSKPSLFEALLKSENINLSHEALDKCEENLRNNPTGLLFLKKLRLQKLDNNYEKVVEEENSHLDYLENEMLSSKTFLIERIYDHIKSKNIDRVLELLSLYEKNGFSYTPLLLTQLISLFSISCDLKKTKAIFEKLKNQFPSFKLDISKLFDYASLLTKYSEFEETLNVFKDCLSEPYVISNQHSALRSIKRFCTVASDTRNIEFVKSIQNLIIPLSKYVGSLNIFLEPLIHVHVWQNDVLSAFEEYKNILIKYRIPAGLKSILKKCINTGDKTTLQKVIDLTINHSGRNIALLELSIAFIETGYSDKATTVISNLGLEADPIMIDEICAKMSNQNRLLDLEQFVNATKTLPHVDKEKLYCHLLQIYADRNEYNKVLEVYNELKKEVDKLGPQVINILTNVKKNNNQFMPENIAVLNASLPIPELSRVTEILVKYIEEKNAELAISELNGIKKGYIRSLSSKIFIDLIDLCVEKNCVRDLSLNVNAMSYIIENSSAILKPLLEKYSTVGEAEKLVAIANYFPDFSLKKIGFNTYFCKAFISNNKHEMLLAKLEDRWNKSNKLFSTYAFEELLKFPELEDRVLKLAKNYLELNYDRPLATIWVHYFTKENYEKAEEVFKLFSNLNIFPIDGLNNSKVLRIIRKNENISLGFKYINFINRINLRDRIKTAAYGTLLDVLVLKQKYDDAVNLAMESEKMQLLLHKHYRSTLITLKSALEKEGKSVPFIVPNEDFIPDINSDSK